MKFDLHCHTKEGSIDSKVTLERYVELLKAQEFDGFMITDHNAYRACKAWDKMKHRPEFKDFIVLRGIEYDTKDAGHILIVMPDGLYLPILNIRGMTLRRLLKIVHRFGGILGPAHPFGVRSSSAMYFKNMNMDLIERFDFIEAFNTCESSLSNELALQLAEKYDLPTFAGSDAHEERYVGMAETVTHDTITCNNDLIQSVKAAHPLYAGGTIREYTVKAKRKDHWTGVWGYTIYNRGVAKLISPYRKYHHLKLPFRS